MSDPGVLLLQLILSLSVRVGMGKVTLPHFPLKLTGLQQKQDKMEAAS